MVCQGHIEHWQAGTGSHYRQLPPEYATGPCVTGVQRVPGPRVFDTPWSPTLGAAQASQ
jgi:multidrug resistance efflux pump